MTSTSGNTRLKLVFHVYILAECDTCMRRRHCCRQCSHIILSVLRKKWINKNYDILLINVRQQMIACLSPKIIKIIMRNVATNFTCIATRIQCKLSPFALAMASRKSILPFANWLRRLLAADQRDCVVCRDTQLIETFPIHTFACKRECTQRSECEVCESPAVLMVCTVV